MITSIIKGLFFSFCAWFLFVPISVTFAAAQAESSYISISPHDCDTNKPNQKLELNCKTYHQTQNNTCGPAAVMTLMHYYGRLSDSDMTPRTELRIAMEMGVSDTGTTQRQVSDWLSSHGFTVDSGTNISSRDIINNLNKKILTLIAVNHHWILAKGYSKGDTSADDEIYFSDSCCGTTMMTADAIDSMWQQAKLPENHCAYNIGEYIVVTP